MITDTISKSPTVTTTSAIYIAEFDCFHRSIELVSGTEHVDLAVRCCVHFLCPTGRQLRGMGIFSHPIGQCVIRPKKGPRKNAAGSMAIQSRPIGNDFYNPSWRKLNSQGLWLLWASTNRCKQRFQPYSQGLSQFGQGINPRLAPVNFPILNRVYRDPRALG